MRMLQDGQEADTNISWEEQSSINRFSSLNTQTTALEQNLRALEQEHEFLGDSYTELELAEDDERVPYRVGDVFVSILVHEARARIEERKGKLEKEMEILKERRAKFEGEMTALKKDLYERFKDQIHLERD